MLLLRDRAVVTGHINALGYASCPLPVCLSRIYWLLTELENLSTPHVEFDVPMALNFA